MIRCHQVTKRFRKTIAVDNVSFEISSGVCALIGPNGAGKSTLLKMLTGLLLPDTGEVSIAGLNVYQRPLDVKRIIGVMPEDLGLFDSLTLQEHLELASPIYGLSPSQTRERMGDLLRVLGLGPARNTFLNQCSHGTRKKTALALALLHNPRVLFLDEPFEGIDPVSARTIGTLLTAIAGRGVTVFLTSHILPLIDQLATQAMMIRDGRILWSSAPVGQGSPQPTPRRLDEIYFELLETVPSEDLAWLRSSPY